MEVIVHSESCSVLSDAQGTMEQDTATSRKRRRKATPLDVSQVRRSVRANSYLGFKAPSLADKKKKESHVKPRYTPDVMMLPAEQEEPKTMRICRFLLQPPSNYAISGNQLLWRPR